MKITIIEPFKKFITIIFLWGILGIIISCNDTTLQNNYLHVIFVNLILITEIYVINKISEEEKKLKQNISGLKISLNYNLMEHYNKLSLYFSNHICHIIPILIGIIYLYFLLSLNILNIKSFIFYYGMITLIITVYYAIRLYIKYFFYIYFIKKISDCDFNNVNYNRLFPNRTEWIICIADFMNKFKYYFSILGCFYTLEYFHSMNNFFIFNKNNVTINITISTPNNNMFIISWIIIFIFIGVGYFVSYKTYEHYLLKIINKYKNLTLKEYETIEQKKTQDDDNYIKIYTLYLEKENNKVIYTDTFLIQNFIPYIPIFLNVYKFFNMYIINMIIK